MSVRGAGQAMTDNQRRPVILAILIHWFKHSHDFQLGKRQKRGHEQIKKAFDKNPTQTVSRWGMVLLNSERVGWVETRMSLSVKSLANGGWQVDVVLDRRRVMLETGRGWGRSGLMGWSGPGGSSR